MSEARKWMWVALPKKTQSSRRKQVRMKLGGGISVLLFDLFETDKTSPKFAKKRLLITPSEAQSFKRMGFDVRGAQPPKAKKVPTPKRR